MFQSLLRNVAQHLFADSLDIDAIFNRVRVLFGVPRPVLTLFQSIDSSP